MTEPSVNARSSPGKPKAPPPRLLWVEAVAAATPIRPGTVKAAQRRAPRGDGHAVLMLPGFLKGDGYTLPLRHFLAGLGYAAYGWGLGINLGPTEAALAGVGRRLDEIRRRHGGRVSLIGHSLGGTIARELAKERPQDIRQLIVLTSPIRLPTASPLEPLYRLLSRWHSAASVALAARLDEPPTVPVTAIFTRSDGILAWESCLECEGPRRENVELGGPHATMARNPAAWCVIADRLAQPEGTWRPYRLRLPP